MNSYYLLVDLLGILYDIPEAEKVGLSYKRVFELQDIEGNSVKLFLTNIIWYVIDAHSTTLRQGLLCELN